MLIKYSFKILTMKYIIILFFLTIFNFCHAQDYKINLDSLNLRMDNRNFQFNCLEKARKVHPDSVYELYIYKCSEDYDDKPFPRDILKYKNLRILIITQSFTGNGAINWEKASYDDINFWAVGGAFISGATGTGFLEKFAKLSKVGRFFQKQKLLGKFLNEAKDPLIDLVAGT
ncbi:MAG: hypothetical protein COZ18_00455, partial [Flexibacter sp. CG_4_10_14_3_um_filter_32_15]